jgi:transposase
MVLRRYWTNACQNCAIKHSCTTGKERRITVLFALPTFTSRR